MTAVTVRDRAAAIRTEIETTWAPDITKGAYRGFTPDRIQAAFLVAATKNPAIFDCTKQSLYLAIMRTARWGLDIGDTVHLVPYGKTCEAVVDYRGLKALAIRQGLIRHMDEYAVWQGDDFDYSLGVPNFLRHKPCQALLRGPLIGAYTVVTLPRGIQTFHFLQLSDIELRRAKSQSWGPSKYASCPPWYALKAVVRDYLGRQPKSGALGEALEYEEHQEGEVIAEPLAESLAEPAPRRGIAPMATEGKPGHDRGDGRWDVPTEVIQDLRSPEEIADELRMAAE